MFTTPLHPLKATLLACALILVPVVAFSADDIRELLCTQEYGNSMRTPTMFQKIDADSDGQVSLDEVVAYFGKIFDALDVDHNGVLDDKEWIGARTNVPVINYSSGGFAKQLATDQMMHIMDRENHKVVTRADFIAQHERIFAGMNAGRKEPLSSQQWLAAHFPK